MQIKTHHKENLIGVKTDIIVEFVFAGPHYGSGGLLQRRAFARTFKTNTNFQAAKGAVSIQSDSWHQSLFGPGGGRDVMWVGLGAREEFSRDVLRFAATAAFRKVRELGARNVCISTPTEFIDGMAAAEFAETVVSTAGLIDYTINHQKGVKLRFKEPVRIESLIIWDSLRCADFVTGAEAGLIIANAVIKARNLTNEPASTCTAEKLAREARHIAGAARSTVNLQVLETRALSIFRAGAILAVNAGSAEGPALIHAVYTPANPVTDKVLALVGKSVTFDTGGLDLKTAAGMRYMKRDMAGGAATLAAFEAIVKLGLAIKVVLIMAATDNAIGKNAMKPGDIITTMSGITVEVDNTDAEGRLTLADAISFAKLQAVDYIIDLATLTGAVRSIGGDIAAAAFSNDEKFLAQVDAAATAGGERVMPMRMWEQARALNDSPMADLKNSGGDPGSLTAAWFIREFADWDKKVTWAHLDIAGVAHRPRAVDQDPAEATGWGVRTLVELTRALAAEKTK